MKTAVVVGSGPNGLAAAIVLARAGLDVTVAEAESTVGGGMRSAELTLPGLIHDTCSAIHPMAQASPFFRTLDLARHGLEWRWPEVEAAHPLDRGRAALLVRGVGATAARLGKDGVSWANLFEKFSRRADELFDHLLAPMLRVPSSPGLLASFGSRGLQPATWLARRWESDEAQALFGGMAAHAIRPLASPTTAALGMALTIAAHAYGWPVAKGGSQALADALVQELFSHGGRIETGQRVRSLPDADVVMLDTSPTTALEIAGRRVTRGIARSLSRWEYGPAAFKLDLAVEDGIPWSRPEVRGAGTVHVGGTLAEIVRAEADVAAGRMPDRPFVLAGQQHVADPSRSRDNVHPVWLYAHVPRGYSGDAREAIVGQVERFAPGFRDRIVATAVNAPADIEAANANYVGGDISCGANTPRQVIFRPRADRDPYRLGPGIYLCSAATHPGAGVHGMGGANAAASALRSL